MNEPFNSAEVISATGIRLAELRQFVADGQHKAAQQQELFEAQIYRGMAEQSAAISTAIASLERTQSDARERIAALKDAADRQAARVADAIVALRVPQDGDPGKDADPDLVAGIVAERLSVEIGDAIRSDVDLIRADVAAIADGVDEKIAAQVSLKIGELPDMAPVIAEMVAARVAALPPAAPGKDADPAVIAEMVADEVAKLPPAEPGKSVDHEELRATVIAEVETAVKARPVPADGHTPTIDELFPLVETAVSHAVAALPTPKNGEDGKSLAPADVADMIAGEVTKAVAALPVPKDGESVDLAEVERMVVVAASQAMSSRDDCVPDYLAETVSKAISTLAESPPMTNASAAAPSIVLNISGGSDRRASKTITTRRDDAGNLIAEVVES